jgi:ABC-type bacteriocin/lantibiotic exporter with double-glycine peptidase domain
MQSAFSDCGYDAVVALLRHFRVSTTTTTKVKRFVGSTERGVDVRTLCAGLRSLGADARLIAFDSARPSSFPCPGIVLLPRGHYVVITKRRGDTFTVYDPAIGWQKLTSKRLELSATALGIEVKFVELARIPVEAIAQPQWSLAKLAIRASLSRFGLRVLFLALAAEVMMLALPLLTQRSVDTVSTSMGSSSFTGFTLLNTDDRIEQAPGLLPALRGMRSISFKQQIANRRFTALWCRRL